jgi:hypothetical protein
MELRWGSSIGSAVAPLLGLLIAWPFVVGAASMAEGETIPNIPRPAFLDDLASVSNLAPGAQVIAAQAPSAPVVLGGSQPRTMSEPPSVSQPTAEFVHELRMAGLLVSASGARIVAEGAGLGTARQLLLSQMAADQFGIAENPFFDPMRVAVIRNGQAIVDLATGVVMSHEIGWSMFGTTEVIGMDLLEELRSDVGWSITAVREAEAAAYEKTLGYVPAYLQSDEAYALYKERARANYEALAAAA